MKKNKIIKNIYEIENHKSDNFNRKFWSFGNPALRD
jgi:hypothetical protein